MLDKRRLVTSKVCFGSKKAGLLENYYYKCALDSKCLNFDIYYEFMDKQSSSLKLIPQKMNSFFVFQGRLYPFNYVKGTYLRFRELFLHQKLPKLSY